MASFLVRVCFLLACATALADEGGGTVVWARRGRARLHCAAASRLGDRLPPHLALNPDGGAGAVTSRAEALWWRDGEQLRHVGGSLKADAPGEYRCSVRMPGGVVLGVKQIVAVPALAKKFTVEPSDATVAVGRSVAFRCSVESAPPANFTWTRDGEPLPLVDRFYVVSGDDGGALAVTNVTLADAGSYSCHASNQYLNKSRTSRPALLTVTTGPHSDSSPRFLLDSCDVRTGPHALLLLPCLHDGAPDLQVEWRYSASEERARDDRVVSTDAVYRMSDLQASDAGYYTCTVKGHPHLTKTCRVEVTVPARITKPPESIHKPSAGVVRFDCSAEGSPTPRVTWYRNGRPLELGGRVNVLKGRGAESPLQLVIGGVQPSDAGVYQCFAQSGDSAPATAYAVLGVAGSALPAPGGLRCRPTALDSVRLEWSPLSNGTDSRAVYYTVHYSKYGCLKCKEQTQPVTAPQTDVRLTAGARYRLYVRAYMGKDASEGSATVICRGQGVPVKMWKDIDSVVVGWKESDCAGGCVLQHRVAGTERITELDLPTYNNSVVLPGVTSDDDLEVRVLLNTTEPLHSQDLSLVPWTSAREAFASSAIASDDGTDDQSGPVVPSGLTVTAQASRALRVSWRCPTCENSTSAYTFVLCYRPISYRGYNYVCINSDSNSAEVGALEPGTQYEMKVQALLQRGGGGGAGGGGPFSETLLASTLHDESRRIAKVEHRYTDSGLRIWWTVYPTQTPSNDTVFTVHYSQNLTRPLNQWMQTNVTGDTFTELTGLDPNLKTFVVVSSRSHGQEEHGPVMDVPPRSASTGLPQYLLLGIIAGAVVSVICLLCCVALCVWRQRKSARTRRLPSAATNGDGATEMMTRSGGVRVNGVRRRGADEPLLNGRPPVRTAHLKPTPNGQYPRSCHNAFDLSRRDEADTTLDTILELDSSDLHHPGDPPDPHRPGDPPDLHHSCADSSQREPAGKLPDDNMNSESARFGSGARAPTLQPNG